MTAQFELSAIVRRAFHAAFLLTGNTVSAERVVLCAIESLSPEDVNPDVWLTKMLEETIQRLEQTAEREESSFEDNLPCIPAELGRVLQMERNLRHCFVVRVLLGFPEERSARLLRLNRNQLRSRTSEAMRWLAGLPSTSFGLSALPKPVETKDLKGYEQQK